MIVHTYTRTTQATEGVQNEVTPHAGSEGQPAGSLHPRKGKSKEYHSIDRLIHNVKSRWRVVQRNEARRLEIEERAEDNGTP